MFIINIMNSPGGKTDVVEVSVWAEALEDPGVGDCRGLLPVLMMAEEFEGLRLLFGPCIPPLLLNVSESE